MKDIPFNRKVIYTMLLGAIPLFFVILSFLSSQQAIVNLENTLLDIQHQVVTYEKKQAINNSVRTYYRDADHFYIDKHLETLNFLEKELESLQKVVKNKNFVEDPLIKRRLELLMTGNALAFSEGATQSFKTFQETAETLVHPVEVNNDDIKKILTKCEGIAIGPYSPGPNRPQLLITDFKIEKKKISEKEEVYSLDLKLIKREFL